MATWCAAAAVEVLLARLKNPEAGLACLGRHGERIPWTVSLRLMDDRADGWEHVLAPTARQPG